MDALILEPSGLRMRGGRNATTQCAQIAGECGDADKDAAILSFETLARTQRVDQQLQSVKTIYLASAGPISSSRALVR